VTAAVFAAPDIEAIRRADGSVVLRSRQALQPHPPTVTHAFRTGSERHPDRVLATEPAADGRVTLTWGQARAQADAVAQALLDAGLGPERPLLVLSANSLAHLVLMLGAHTAGVPIVPVSTAYSLASADHLRLRAIARLCRPGLVVAEDEQAYGPALTAVAEASGADIAAGGDAIARLRDTRPTSQVQRAFDATGPDTVAKLLFTSGSTGTPKGVLTTQRMLASNQQALRQVWPFLADEPPVLVDWLPWSHTFGGNHNLNQVLTCGGTLHIDDGKPVAALFERTVEALRAHPPTVYYNVPAGFALLAPRLEEDPELARAFFSRLRFAFYAAAALPPALWDRLRALADEHAPRHVPLTASWGATETAPGATSAHFAAARCGCIGVPLPGTTIKLAPEADKLEIRVKGPNVMPGYHANPEATDAAFDDEGFYRTGDAARLVADDDPGQGLMFDGRLAEDFKLATGTWVTVGRLRPELVSALGVVRDAVITGHDRDEVGALVWLAEAAADGPRVRELIAERLAAHNEGMGSASRVSRVLVLDEPPAIDAGEITDKGYVNQGAVLRRRAELVARLHAEPVDPAVIVAERSGAVAP
jgi:feruloyl-CoA synthase